MSTPVETATLGARLAAWTACLRAGARSLRGEAAARFAARIAATDGVADMQEFLLSPSSEDP